MTDDTKGDDWLPGLTDPVEIGRGGFGVVYKALETDLNRTVAVKILSGNLDELALQRFDRERRAMGALSGHPNIVAIYRTGLTGDDRPYLVMEFLRGGSMAEQVAARGPMSWQETAEVGVRLSAALETAHRAGVLHRDVKPENVFVSDLGAPKLGDFGIARLEGAPQTRSATITASFAHASPELIDGRPPSVQSDIYALASTLLTLMSGRPPFVRDTDESIVPLLARIATEPVPDLRARGVPDALCQVFETAMAKDPGHRYASTADFGRALQAAQRSSGLDVTPLEVQGVDPTVAPGAGAPAVAAQTVTVAPVVTAPPITPVAPPQPPAAVPPVTTPVPGVGVSAQPAAAAVTSTGPPTGATPSVASYPVSTGTAQVVESGGQSRTVLILALVAVVVLVAVGAVALLGSGDSNEQSDSPRPTIDIRDRIEDRLGTTTSAEPDDGSPTTLEPGTEGPFGVEVTPIPFELGDAPALDRLVVDCSAGELGVCDQLYNQAPRGSRYEAYGGTCGDREPFSTEALCSDLAPD